MEDHSPGSWGSHGPALPDVPEPGWQLVAELTAPPPPPQHLSQETMLNISFLKLLLNPSVVHRPVSDQIWECLS